jgi:hypothetical protein
MIERPPPDPVVSFSPATVEAAGKMPAKRQSSGGRVRRWYWAIVACFLLLVLGGGYYYRDMLRRTPSPDVESARNLDSEPRKKVDKAIEDFNKEAAKGK